MSQIKYTRNLSNDHQLVFFYIANINHSYYAQFDIWEVIMHNKSYTLPLSWKKGKMSKVVVAVVVNGSMMMKSCLFLEWGKIDKGWWRLLLLVLLHAHVSFEIIPSFIFLKHVLYKLIVSGENENNCNYTKRWNRREFWLSIS